MFNKALKSRIAMVAVAALILILGSVAVSVIMGNYQDNADAQSLTATFEPVVQKNLAVKAAMVTEEQQAQALPTSIIVSLPTVTPTPVAVAMVEASSQPQAQPTPVAVAMANAAPAQAVLPAPVAAMKPQVQPIGAPAANAPMTAQQIQAEILAKDDDAVIWDRTPGWIDPRFGVTALGQKTGVVVNFSTDKVDSFMGRIACDDDCTGFYLVRKSDGAVIPVVPQYFWPHDYNYQSLPADVRQVAADYGVNVVESEMLGQYLFTTPVPVSPGDKLVILGHDDPLEGVNRGVFFSWHFLEGEAVQVGPLNQ